MFVHSFAEKCSGFLTKGQNSQQSCLAPFLSLHNSPAQLQVSLLWVLTMVKGGSAWSLLPYLPFTSIKTHTQLFSHMTHKLPSLRQFKIMSWDIFWMLFHPASKSTAAIQAFIYPYPSQPNNSSFRNVTSVFSIPLHLLKASLFPSLITQELLNAQGITQALHRYLLLTLTKSTSLQAGLLGQSI